MERRANLRLYNGSTATSGCYAVPRTSSPTPWRQPKASKQPSPDRGSFQPTARHYLTQHRPSSAASRKLGLAQLRQRLVIGPPRIVAGKRDQPCAFQPSLFGLSVHRIGNLGSSLARRRWRAACPRSPIVLTSFRNRRTFPILPEEEQRCMTQNRRSRPY
jgi:hypothetical protein